MTPYYTDDSVTLFHGDCIKVMRELAAGSVDAVVCDPPYGLGFMGKEWDTIKAESSRPQSADEIDERFRNVYPRTGKGQAAVAFDGQAFQAWCVEWAQECLRVLKPGGHLLAFGGTRTSHRLAVAIEDAGFEIRDSIAWLYGSGFPKSLDVGKAIDKAAGAEREVIGKHPMPGGTAPRTAMGDGWQVAPDITAPATDAARTWQGWGTALKPAHEPIVVARKPLVGTVAGNVLAHGVGALNIDATRIGENPGYSYPKGAGGTRRHDVGLTPGGRTEPVESLSGRWPANVVLDEGSAAALDTQSGTLTSGAMRAGTTPKGARAIYGQDAAGGYATKRDTYADTGGASRFFYCAPIDDLAERFRYVAKAPTTERPSIYSPSCDCESSWPTTSPVTDTAAAATAADSSTSKSGSDTTASPSLPESKFTTSTETNSTTSPPISSPSPPPNTSDCIPAANSETGSGGNRAVSAGSSSGSAPPTGISAEKDGHSTGGVVRATSHGLSARSVCGDCGAPASRESHATVKPLSLMRWLVRLVTPRGGTVLDPFFGSGTTGEACVIEHFRCIGIEQHEPYLAHARQRLSKPIQPGLDFGESA